MDNKDLLRQIAAALAAAIEQDMVLHVTVETRTSSVDVTSFSDSVPQYMAGPIRREATIQFIMPPDVEITSELDGADMPLRAFAFRRDV